MGAYKHTAGNDWGDTVNWGFPQTEFWAEQGVPSSEASKEKNNPTRRTTGSWVKLGEEAIPREERSQWLSSTKWSAIKIIHLSNVIWTLGVIFSNIYVHIKTYMHAITVGEIKKP